MCDERDEREKIVTPTPNLKLDHRWKEGKARAGENRKGGCYCHKHNGVRATAALPDGGGVRPSFLVR